MTWPLKDRLTTKNIRERVMTKVPEMETQTSESGFLMPFMEPGAQIPRTLTGATISNFLYNLAMTLTLRA